MSDDPTLRALVGLRDRLIAAYQTLRALVYTPELPVVSAGIGRAIGEATLALARATKLVEEQIKARQTTER